MDVLATAIRFGAKITDLTSLELCYAPPFGSAKDPVNMLGYVGENIVTGKVRQFFWHDVQSLPRDGSAPVSYTHLSSRRESYRKNAPTKSRTTQTAQAIHHIFFFMFITSG